MAASENGKAGRDDEISDLMPGEGDLLYEEEILRNPFSLRMWGRYIDARKDAPDRRRFLLYERALQKLPGSYKLWHRYLQERAKAVRGLSPGHPGHDGLLNTFERALVTMHKMPRVWIELIETLVSQGHVTRTRRTLDRALAALPVTQHDRLWPLYLRFVTQRDLPMDTALRVYRRYLKMEPGHREEFITYLRAQQQWGAAAAELAEAVNDDSFRSIEGKSKHHLWLELCDLVTRHPDDVRGKLDVDGVIRAGIRKFTNEVGRLWCALADYYIRQGMFERARDVYQEGIEAVMTVRDFTLVFEALTKFEQALVTAQILELGDEDDGAGAAAGPPEGDGADFLLTDDGNDVDLRLARLEWLLQRRPLLLSSVMLRQNPHNVSEWHKRVHLFEGDAAKQIETYTEAVKTVDCGRAVGKPHTLWCAFAHFYERHGDLANARLVFEKATQVRYTYVDDLAHVWCQWAEMELKHRNFRRARDLLARALAQPVTAEQRLTADEQKSLPPQAKVYRSARVWSLFVDLVESSGSVAGTREAYERMLDLKVASPQVVLNYADFLKERRFWEDAFRVYERGVGLFGYPHAEPIWNAYLTSFVDRHKGTKLERARDLFAQACAEAPEDKRLPLYLMWADFEERHGLAAHLYRVLEAAARGVPAGERAGVYRLFADKARALHGISKVREVYATACEAEPPHDVPDDDTLALCLEFAAVERDLNEIDRARAIFVFASHLAEPVKHSDFWSAWEDFEARHGNVETFYEMNRVKRSVAVSFAKVHLNTTNAEAAVAVDDVDAAADPIARLEASLGQQKRSAVSGFVSAGVQPASSDAEPAAKRARAATNGAPAAAASAANPEEIDLGADDGDDDES